MVKLISFGFCILFLLGLSIVVYSATTISTCTNIIASGEYLLDTDITDSAFEYCMNITANNVTLDCQGNNIDGVDTILTYGVFVLSSYNITVRNCNVTDWFSGVTLSLSNDSNVEDIVGSSNYYTLELSGANRTNVTNLTASYDGYGGILNDESDYSIFIDITSHHQNGTAGSLGYGMSIELENSDYNIVINSTFYNNRWGMYNYECLNCNFSNNVFRNNSQGSIRDRRTENSFYYNNLFNDSIYFVLASTEKLNSWNTSNQTGIRIYSSGTNIGGNYYTNSSGDGYSDICTDSNTDGFCDTPFNLTSGKGASGIGLNIDYLPLSDEYGSGVDITPPSFSLNSTNASSTTYNSTDVQINLTIKDDSTISAYTLSTTDTSGGTWANETIVNLAGDGNVTMVWNYTIENFPLAGGTFSWRVWANDTSGNVNISNIYTFSIGNNSLASAVESTSTQIRNKGFEGMINFLKIIPLIGGIFVMIILVVGFAYIKYGRGEISLNESITFTQVIWMMIIVAIGIALFVIMGKVLGGL